MSRTPICMCNNCTSIGTHKVEIAKRGNRFGYMCDFHFFHTEGYNDENGFRKGNRKVNGFTYSCEFETSASTAKGRGELLDFGFLPTHDCTVNVEYKSPIYEGLNAISKQLTSIDNLMCGGDLDVGNNCGTHFHVGHVDHINPTTMDYIRRFYHSIFVPLSDCMKNNPTETTAFWGRNFTYYASPIDRHTSPTDHCNFINLQHAYTVEFRLAKFINASQYMNVVKFSRDVINAVIENFIKHFNDTDFDRSRYADATAYRKHKATVTANKIVKLYCKYAGINA